MSTGLPCLLALAMLAATGHALSCYKCNTEGGPHAEACRDLDGSIQPESCDPIGDYKYCVKHTLTYQGYTSVERRCTDYAQIGCSEFGGGDGAEQYTGKRCGCQTDGCNDF